MCYRHYILCSQPACIVYHRSRVEFECQFCTRLAAALCGIWLHLLCCQFGSVGGHLEIRPLPKSLPPSPERARRCSYLCLPYSHCTRHQQCPPRRNNLGGGDKFSYSFFSGLFPQLTTTHLLNDNLPSRLFAFWKRMQREHRLYPTPGPYNIFTVRSLFIIRTNLTQRLRRCCPPRDEHTDASV